MKLRHFFSEEGSERLRNVWAYAVIFLFLLSGAYVAFILWLAFTLDW